MVKKRHQRLGHWLKTSIWAFPAVLAVILIIFTALKISGTSVGMYYPRFYGPTAHDPNLIYGHPRAIRSDEWLAGTQMTISQAKNGYPRFNQDFGSGREVSLTGEIPSKDWSTIFKPHNWSFLVLPLEYAFAFKWWLLMYLLAVSCYFFTLCILPKQKWFAILFGLAFGLSPFCLWWWQTSSFLCLAYSFLIAIMVMRIIDSEPIPLVKNQKLTNGLYVLGFSFLLACFGLLFYPPFQIPVAIVLLFFSLGYILEKKINAAYSWQRLVRRLGLIIGSLVLTAGIGVIFLATHQTPIKALNHSLYPGHRRVVGGNLKVFNIFDAYVMPLEQSDRRSGHFIGNQSESSNFILLLPFLILASLAVIAREWQLKKQVDWVFLSIQLCALLLFLRVFTDFGNGFYRLLLLDRVPNKRIIVGFGLLGALQIIYLVRKVGQLKLNRQKLNWWAGGYAGACFIILLTISAYITHHYPMFTSKLWILAVPSAIFAGMIWALLANRKMIFVGLFLIFSMASSFRIIPLYRGLGLELHSQLIQKMTAISKPHQAWAAVGDDAGIYENFGWLAGRRSISGAQLYPDTNFWRQVAGPSYAEIYNRQGHAFFTDSPNMTAPLEKASSDSFRVKFQCSAFIKHYDQFALSVHPLMSGQACTKLVTTVHYPQVTFYLYKIISN